MESKAVFKARCVAVGLSPADTATLVSEGIETMAKLAFVSGTQPGANDDKEFVEVMKKVFSIDNIPVGTLSSLRRLWFEASSMAISEVKSRYEKTEDSLPKRLPLPEREHRRLHQQNQLSGLSIEGNLEPAHSLIDLCMTIKEEDVVRYICPSVCISREAEVKGLKKETLVKADSQGQLKAVTKDNLPVADLSSEYRLRLALQRRSLAMDQMGLMTYHAAERYHTYLFDLLLRPVPATHRTINVQQLLEADKHIFARMSEYCRTGLAVTAAGTYPMETALERALLDPITVALLQPLPIGGSSYNAVKNTEHANRDTPFWENRKGKKGEKGGKGKNSKGSSKGGGKGYQYSGPSLPKGLSGSTTTRAGKRICFGYNLGQCNDKDCKKGLHVCCKCFANDHSFQSCPQKI
jgi:hypothetical protein